MKKTASIFIMISMLFILAACGSGNDKNADNFPDKQIEVIVPFAAGGASDLVSRTIATEMENELDVPVVITNKTGGSGATGLQAIKNAKPNGYTIGYAPAELAMLESLELAEVSPNDFDALGQLMTIPAAITVQADAPYDTLDELIAYAKENPGKLKVGNSGAGSIWHIAASAFAQETDIELQHVPYDGAAPAVTALLGGHVDAVAVSPSEAISGIDSGDLKVLAVMSEDPDVNAPDAPTMQDLGYDIDLAGWGGFVAPKELPEEVREKLEDAFEKAYESDAFQKLLEERGMNPDYRNGEDFKDYSTEQYEYFNELIPQVELSEE